MDDKKKMFMIPEGEIVNFSNEDIITLSQGDEAGMEDGEDMGA